MYFRAFERLPKGARVKALIMQSYIYSRIITVLEFQVSDPLKICRPQKIVENKTNY